MNLRRKKRNRSRTNQGNWFSRLSRLKKILTICLIIIIGFVSVGVIYASRLSDLDKLFPGVDFNESNPDEDPDIKDVRDAFNNLDDRFLNILLVGFDRDEERDQKTEYFRADTLMVFAINTETGKVDIVSVPRDTLVPIYKRDGTRDKINSAYGYGWKYGGAPSDDLEEKHRLGMEYQVETVSRTLKGIPIHYYVSVDMDVVVEVVDIIGGVWFDVEKRVYSPKREVLLEPGYQHLDGLKFLDFVRGRRYSDGDITRVKNQQDILVAAFNQLKSANQLANAPKIYASVRDNVDTNLSMEQMVSLAWYGSQNIETDKINQHIVATSFAWGRLSESWTRSYSYLILNQKKRVELIYEVWGIDVTADPTDILFPPLRDEPEPSDESTHSPPDFEDGPDPGPSYNGP